MKTTVCLFLLCVLATVTGCAKDLGPAAEEGLKELGDGALTYYQEEHPDETGMQVFSRVYPKAEKEVCATKPTREGVWDELRFSSNVDGIEWCYQTSADQKQFIGSAKAGDKTYCIKGSADGTLSSIATDSCKLD